MFSCQVFAASNQHIKLEGIEGESEDAMHTKSKMNKAKSKSPTQPRVLIKKQQNKPILKKANSRNSARGDEQVEGMDIEHLQE